MAKVNTNDNKCLRDSIKELNDYCEHHFQTIELGHTKEDITVYAYYINQSAKQTIVIVGMPHGNEPVGFWFCKEFLTRDKRDNDYNYLVIPILDWKQVNEY